MLDAGRAVGVTPYYDQDGITIYHGDCREILPKFNVDEVALLIADPPYGINHHTSDYWHGTRIIGDDKPFDPAPLLRFKRCILWGANYYCRSLPETNGWIVWDKRDATSDRLPGSDAELAWSNVSKSVALFRKVWMPHTIRGEASLHPTQKPVSLMRWILGKWTVPGDLVLDPYMGSGPIAQACYEMERRYIGIEIEGRYCEVTLQRLAQGVLPL